MEGYDWDRDFVENLGDIIVRRLEIESASYPHPGLSEMVERMLVSPEGCGIAVILDNRLVEHPSPVADEPPRVIGTRHFRLDPHVAFGEAWEFPSMLAYEVWQERGCPGPV